MGNEADKEAFLDAVLRYVERRFRGDDGMGMSPVPMRLVSALYSRRARKLFNEDISVLLEGDKARFYVYWHSSGKRLLAPRVDIEGMLDGVKSKTLMLGRLFGDKSSFDTGQEIR